MELLEGGSNKGKTFCRLSVPPNILLFFFASDFDDSDILTMCIKHVAFKVNGQDKKWRDQLTSALIFFIDKIVF